VGIFNGNVEGDREGEWTFTGGRGETVIDYVIGSIVTKEIIEGMVVEDCIDSDHHPLVVWIRKEEEEQRKGGKMERVGRWVWTEEGIEEFRKELGELPLDEREVGRMWEGMRGQVKEILKRGSREKGVGTRKGWWDEECEEKKRAVRKALRRWRRGEGGRQNYREGKTEYRKLIERKKKEENEKWERELKIKTEGQVWEMVGKAKKRRRVNEGIKMEEWDKYFRDLLGGVSGRVRRGIEGGRGRDQEEEIGREEIRKVLTGMKDKKAVGVDGIPAEVWKYGGEGMELWVWKICDKIWKGEGWIEEWNEGVIVPIVKKGEGKRVEEYRGVSLTTSLYKVYASVLANRLREEVEGKGLIPQNQTGFRKGLGTIDNIYVLNYLINRQISKSGGKMVALFVDLRAAFDSVDRRILIEAMRDRGVKEGLVVRCEDIVRETRNRVRVGENVGEWFWTGRGVRQGCPLSPSMFNLLTADLEQEMGKSGWGGVKLGEGKIYTLSYADDMVLLAEEEDEMRSLMGKLEGYLDRKRLELNVSKTRIMRFRKGGGRKKKVRWRWKGRAIEEVKEFTYLGYTVQCNGGQEAQVRERLKRGAAVMGKVWGIGKRRFKGDWGRMCWLFDALVWPVIGYGVEVWGWKERGALEKLQERFLKWVLAVEWRTPGYVVREEMKRGKLRERAGIRAIGFEKRLAEGRGSDLARKCWEEMKVRGGGTRVRSGWEEERRKFLEERGVKWGELMEGG